jgi:hypothetical protein
MKKIVSILTFLFTVVTFNAIVSVSENQPLEDVKLKRYELQSGIVKYESAINGKVMGSTINGSGTRELYFKDWGSLELVEETETKTTVSNMFGNESIQEETTHNMSKLDNGKAFYVDFKNKEIRSQNDLGMELVKTFNNGDANETGKSMLSSMGGEKIGVEKVLGFECEIWSLMGTKQWIYKGVTLKMESSIMGMVTIQIATEAKFNITVSDIHFKLPDYRIIEPETFEDEDYYEETEADKEEMRKQMDLMKDMTYEEYKAMVLSEDEEASEMTEEEMKQSYAFFKLALQRINKNK